MSHRRSLDPMTRRSRLRLLALLLKKLAMIRHVHGSLVADSTSKVLRLKGSWGEVPPFGLDRMKGIAARDLILACTLPKSHTNTFQFGDEG